MVEDFHYNQIINATYFARALISLIFKRLLSVRRILLIINEFNAMRSWQIPSICLCRQRQLMFFWFTQNSPNVAAYIKVNSWQKKHDVKALGKSSRVFSYIYAKNQFISECRTLLATATQTHQQLWSQKTAL